MIYHKATTVAFAAMAFSLSGSFAFPQGSGSSDNSIPQITVSASHGVKKKQKGLSYTGIPIEQVALSRKVGFSDLTLSTPAGKAELDKRIKTVAEEACHQLSTLYPLESWDTDNRTCVADAIQNAMAQEHTLVASASKN